MSLPVTRSTEKAEATGSKGARGKQAAQQQQQQRSSSSSSSASSSPSSSRSGLRSTTKLDRPPAADRTAAEGGSRGSGSRAVKRRLELDDAEQAQQLSSSALQPPAAAALDAAFLWLLLCEKDAEDLRRFHAALAAVGCVPLGSTAGCLERFQCVASSFLTASLLSRVSSRHTAAATQQQQQPPQQPRSIASHCSQRSPARRSFQSMRDTRHCETLSRSSISRASTALLCPALRCSAAQLRRQCAAIADGKTSDQRLSGNNSSGIDSNGGSQSSSGPLSSAPRAQSRCDRCGGVSCLRSLCQHCLSLEVCLLPADVDWLRVRQNRAKVAGSIAKLAAAKQLQRASKRSQPADSEDLERDSSQPQDDHLTAASRTASTGSNSSCNSSSSASSSPAVRCLCAESCCSCFAAADDSQLSRAPSAGELWAWREESVLRSLHWCAQFVRRSKAAELSSNGGDLVFLYRFLIERSSRPQVVAAARQTVSCLLERWERLDASQLDDYSEADQLQNVAECLHAKQALQGAEAGEVRRLREKVRSALRHHSVEDICRFNPNDVSSLPQSQCGYCSSCGSFQAMQHRTCCPSCSGALSHPPDLDALCESLVWLSVYRDVGLHPLVCCDGLCSLGSALRFVRQVRPYRGLLQLSADQFRFQSYLVTHLVFVASTHAGCWYALQLPRRLFAEELLFLLHNLQSAIGLHDPELTGEFLCALRLLGCEDQDVRLQAAYAFLLQTEQSGNAAGSWLSSSAGFYKRYHAAYCATIGLAEMQTVQHATMTDEPLWRELLD